MLELPERHVHLWCLTIDQPKYDISFWVKLLDVDERVRVDRFRRQHDRDFFIWCRGNLRRTLAAYLGAAPQDIRYRTSRLGKPEIDKPFGDHWLRFSVSHSGDRMMIAIARDSEVGVDIEQIRPMADLSEAAGSVFSRREQSLFCSLSEGDRLTTFYSVWAQKEAYLKARGLGLNRPLQDIDVGLYPAEGFGLISDRQDPSAAASWSLRAWLLEHNYVAALATSASSWLISHMADGHPSA